MLGKSKKLLLCMMGMFILSFQVQAGVAASLEDISKPDSMVVYRERLYVAEQAIIRIYSLKDLKLIKSFGQQGEGPREFKVSPFGPPVVVIPYDDYLLINSDNKVSYFTHNGEFIKEYKTQPFSIFLLVGKNFVGNGMVAKENNIMVLTVNLYDAQFKKIKELYQSNIEVGQNVSLSIPPEPFAFPVIDDRIFIVRGWDFIIDVFDSNGTKLYTIRKDYRKQKLDAAYKKRRLDWYQNESPLKQFWEFFKDRVRFNDYFPAVQDLYAESGRLYALTHQKRGEKSECIVMDLKGRVLKRVFLTVPEAEGFAPPIYSIDKGRYYTLVENLEQETWDLVIEEIM